MVARRRQAVVSGLAELADLYIVLKQDGVCFCLIIAYFADDLDEVAERVLGMRGPSVEANYDSFMAQLVDLIGADVESAVFIVGRHKLIYLEIPSLFTLLPHGAVLGGVHQLASVDTATVIPLLLLVNGHYLAAGQQVAVALQELQ